LRIELLKVNDVVNVIGISEIYNSNNLTQEELLDIAKSMSNDSLTVQLMNGLLIADDAHLLSAAQNAVNAQSGKYMLSRTLDVEIIVYASAQRQIGRALDELGVYDSVENVAVVVVGNDRKSVEQSLEKITTKVGKELSNPFEGSKERFDRIKTHFDIDEKEICTFTDSDDDIERQKALSKCVVSRVSLVAIDT
jgi:tRNA threonylcarbamoyladenosine modification (KEOPS) complex Cgi121 subunit